MSQQKLTLVVQTPTGIVWEGEVQSVISHNQEGEFMILPDHANFMTPLHREDVRVVFADGAERIFHYDEAVLFVEDNQIRMYVHDQPGATLTSATQEDMAKGERKTAAISGE